MRDSFIAASLSPFAAHYPPSAAALSLIGHFLEMERPLDHKMFSGTAVGNFENRFLPVPVAWQLYQIVEEIGSIRNDEALSKIALDAKRWLRGIGSPYLFYRDSDFDEKEAGEFPLASDQYGLDPMLGIAHLSKGNLRASLTLSGSNTGLGSIEFGDVVIPAFGPQTAPLSDMNCFGISHSAAFNSKIEAGPENLSLMGWTRSHGSKETWLHVAAAAERGGLTIDLRWVGVMPNEPNYFSIFVRARTCTLEDGSNLSPASLLRYQGKSQKIIFDKTVQLECSELLNLQVIPLAGVKCFWNATFLVSFEFNSSENRASYSLRFI